MNITFLYHKCYLGGLESATKNRMDYLSRLGADCRIIFAEPGMEDQTFHEFRHHIAPDIETLINLTNDSDIIVNLSPFDTMFKKAYLIDRPIIHECHCGGAFDYLKHLDESKVKAVIFPTVYNLQRARNVISNNIPCFSFPNCLGKSFLDKKPAVLTPLKKIILWSGRVEYYKNWPMIIKIAMKLSHDYLIRVVTDTSLSSNFKEFMTSINNFNLKNKIEVDINCPYDAVSYHYYQAAISGCYLSSSYSESFGMTVLESLYTGCPMVLSDLPSFREIASENAIYFPADNVDLCLQGINRVCSDVSLRNKMISGGHLLYSQSFDPIEVSQKYMNIIRNILDNKENSRT